MANFKLLLPCAGTGSRLQTLTQSRNKALITLGTLPVICHILKQFADDVEVIVPLGFNGDHVRQVLLSIFPNKKIQFINVENFEGPGSGLGHTLSVAQAELQCPFIFIPNDTIIDFSDLDHLQVLSKDWVAYYKKTNGDSVPKDEYRTLEISENIVSQINPKGFSSNNIYLGVAGINDYRTFWENMKDPRSVEIGEAFGLNGMKRVVACQISKWYDTGNLQSLAKAKKDFKEKDYNILEKEDEAIWFLGNRVYKFHVDEKFIKDRIKRLNFLPEKMMPKILFSKKNLYCYEKIEGQIFSQVITEKKFLNLMDNSQTKIWSKRSNRHSADEINSCLDDFYKKKTLKRVKQFLKKYEVNDKEIIINDKLCPAVERQLLDLDWDTVYSKAIIANFHGDFHSENILHSSEGFLLIDWRQNFGQLGWESGDVYYDLSKMLHGLIVAHPQVDKDNYSVNWVSQDKIRIEIHQNLENIECIKIMKAWCGQNGYDFNHVELLTALIYLNICALHHQPYAEFLFYLGRKLLTKVLDK